MTLAHALSRIVTPKGDLNRIAWDGQPGHYEVHYLTLNHRAEKLGVWLRYTLDAPLPGRGAPYCELWGHVFTPDPADMVARKERFPIDQLGREGLVKIGAARLEEGRAVGSVGDLSWDLTWAPAKTVAHLTPSPLRDLGFASTAVVFANQDVRFSGELRFGGRVVKFDHEPGCQTHLHGSKRAPRWAWGHCNAFTGRDDCSLDGVAAWLNRFGKLRGPITGVYVRYRGEDYCLNALPNLFRAKSEVAFPRWKFTGSDRGLTFVGTFEAEPARMLQVVYEDADGEQAFCCNSEVANLTLQVFRGADEIDRLSAEGTAHLEFVDRIWRDEVRPATVRP